MFKYVLPGLLVIGILFMIPSAYSSHNPCQPGYVSVIDSETGFSKCVFDPEIKDEIPPELKLEFADYQEYVQIVANTNNLTTEMSVLLLSSSSQDILIPPQLENAILNSDRLVALIFKNEWECAPALAADPCILVQLDREGLGEFTETIQKHTREIADKIIYDSQFIGLNAEFHSIVIEAGKPSQDIPPLATVVYTTNYFPTQKLVSMIGDQLLDGEIRNGGGFYDLFNKFTENEYTEFHLELIPDNNEVLRKLMVTLSTSNLPADMLGDTISPLNIISASIPDVGNKIKRSTYFSQGFFPLNSIFNIQIITESDYQLKDANANLIATISTPKDLEDAGWFFSSNSNGKIEGRYLFGMDQSVSKNDLIFSITNNRAEYLSVQIHEPAKSSETETESPGGGCLIATAAFGSEMAPQVQLLREIRDNTVLQTESGTSFMTSFNQLYYSFSPAIADYERENPVFKESVKIILTPLLTSLTLLQFADINSEFEMQGYGIGIILLNLGIYFIAPIIFVLKLVKKARVD